MYSSFTIIGALGFFLISNASAFVCKINGYSTSCPTNSDDSEKNFCCNGYCCTIHEYSRENSGVPAGYVIGFVILINILITIGCCCYCEKRRAEAARRCGLDGEQIINVPPNAPSPQIHLPPVSAYSSPSPNGAPPPPYYTQQLPLNPQDRSIDKRISPITEFNMLNFKS